MTIMRLDGVSKTFRTQYLETLAVDSVDLEIREGDYIAVTGESGSGKSTLLSLIGLLELPTSGTLTVAGVDVAAASDAERARWRRDTLGFVFQAFHLIPHLTVSQNVDLALDGSGLASRARSERVADALGKLGLSHRMDHLPTQLSGGQQQRVALARAIVGAPRLLVCDEPTGNLDEANSAAFMDILEEMNQDGTAVLLVTHSATIADRARDSRVMRDGRFV